MGTKVFVRDATGVVRGVSPLDGAIISFLLINWGLGFSLAFAVTPALLPGANMGVAFLLTIPFVIISALSYTMLTEAMPRSGGDYVWISRILNPAFAVGLEFLVTVFQGLLWGSVGAFTVSSLMAPGLEILGLITGNSGLVNASLFLATNDGILIVGTLMVIVAFVCLALPLRHYLKIQFVLWAVGVLSIVLVFAILLGTTHEAFVASFNDFYRANNVTYSGVIHAASAGGLSNPGLATWSTATLLAIPYLFFVVVGFQWPALVGGELKTPKKTMFYGCIIAGIVSVLVEAAGAFMIQGIVGPDFVNAAAYLSYVTGTYPAPVPFNPVFAAMTINRNVIVDTLLFVGLIAWGLLILCAGALVYTRVIMAWGFDRSLPAKLADVNERTHTPILAAAIFCALLELGVIATVYAGVIFANVNMTLLLIILFTVVGLCAMLFPYRCKAMFEMSPLKARKIGRVPTVTIVGVLNVVLFLLLIIFALTYPSLSGPTGALAFTLMGSVFLLGLVLFFVTRVYYKRMGIDTSLAFKEIPPE